MCFFFFFFFASGGDIRHHQCQRRQTTPEENEWDRAECERVPQGKAEEHRSLYPFICCLSANKLLMQKESRERRGEKSEVFFCRRGCCDRRLRRQHNSGKTASSLPLLQNLSTVFNSKGDSGAGGANWCGPPWAVSRWEVLLFLPWTSMSCREGDVRNSCSRRRSAGLTDWRQDLLPRPRHSFILWRKDRIDREI